MLEQFFRFLNFLRKNKELKGEEGILYEIKKYQF
jgi:hypothetical protein